MKGRREKGRRLFEISRVKYRRRKFQSKWDQSRVMTLPIETKEVQQTNTSIMNTAASPTVLSIPTNNSPSIFRRE